MKEEIWKDIKGYEGLYQISNFGNVKSLKREVSNGTGTRIIDQRLLSQVTNRYGYICVTLCKNSKYKHCTIHRLVAEAFIDNPDNLPCVNHKDENKQNNNVDNLEWCSVAYNNSYGSRLGKVSNKNKGKKHSEETKQKLREKAIGRISSRRKPVNQYDLEGNLIRRWDYVRQIAQEWNLSSTAPITNCLKGKHKSNISYGYKWEYAS